MTPARLASADSAAQGDAARPGADQREDDRRELAPLHDHRPGRRLREGTYDPLTCTPLRRWADLVDWQSPLV